MNDMNQEKAAAARAMYDSMNLVMSTPFGKELRNKMDEIDTNASNNALRGPTPENTNVFFESRGRVGAIFQLTQLYRDVDKANKDALAWLQANPPQESA